MENLTIRTIDSAFVAEAHPAMPMRADEALAEGVRGALMIAMDEIGSDSAAITIEVIVQNRHGQQVRHSAVSVSVAPLPVG